MIAWLPLCLPPAPELIEHRLWIAELHTHKPYQEVLEDAEFAITDRNLRITGRLRIGEAIRERGWRDFPRYDVLLFCNLEFARRFLERDPAGVLHCPARVTLREADGGVMLSAPLFPEPPDDPELSRISAGLNELLQAILRDAAAP